MRYRITPLDRADALYQLGNTLQEIHRLEALLRSKAQRPNYHEWRRQTVARLEAVRELREYIKGFLTNTTMVGGKTIQVRQNATGFEIQHPDWGLRWHNWSIIRKLLTHAERVAVERIIATKPKIRPG